MQPNGHSPLEHRPRDQPESTLMLRRQAAATLQLADPEPPEGCRLLPQAALFMRPGAACSQLEDPWRLLPIQPLVDVGMKDMQA